jgi:hypothetical protein
MANSARACGDCQGGQCDVAVVSAQRVTILPSRRRELYANVRVAVSHRFTKRVYRSKDCF